MGQNLPKPMKALHKTVLAALAAVAAFAMKPSKASWQRLKADTHAQIDLGGPLALVGIIVGAILAVIVVSALFGTFVSSVAGINDDLTNETVTFGDTTTDNLKPTFAIIVGISALVGVVGLVLAAVTFRRG